MRGGQTTWHRNRGQSARPAAIGGPAAMVVAALLACVWAAPGGQPDIIVSPGKLEPNQIAIARFDAGTASVLLKTNDFHDIIYRDLEVSGYFARGANQQLIEQTHQMDKKAGKIDFAEWRRVDANFLLEGSYEISGDRLQVTAVLHYVPSGKRIFGKRFTDLIGNQRIVAHRISDEIFSQVTHEKGIANTKILYVSTSDPTRQNREVWVMDADGAGARPLTAENNLVATPCWGANATEVYYTSWRQYNPDLYGVYLKGGTPWTISRFPGLNVSPAWSARRQHIAVTLGKDGNSEIYVMDRNGGNARRLTHNGAIDSSPAWSPDGRDVAFVSNRGGNSPQIYVMDGDGTNPRRISWVGSNYCDAPAWSPDGDKIAFTARNPSTERFDIYVVEVDGARPQQLTNRQGNNEDPVWSPNGLMLAFSSDRAGTSHVYVMNIDGSNQRQITFKGHNASPAWSPFLYEE